MSSIQPNKGKQNKTKKQITSCLNISYSNYCHPKNREKIQKADRIFLKAIS